jgi:aspartate/methionine/tyrosine aminotransferase
VKSKFERINRLPPYIFGEINSLKMKLRSEGRDIIDFGMGNPDMPTPLHIRQKLKEVVAVTPIYWASLEARVQYSMSPWRIGTH